MSGLCNILGVYKVAKSSQVKSSVYQRLANGVHVRALGVTFVKARGIPI